MIRPLLSAFFALAASSLAEEEPRTFTDARGRQFSARLIAADAYRVTIEIPTTGKVTVPQTALSQPDIAFLQTWREQNPKAPLIDAAAIAPWPGQAGATAQVRQLEVTPKSGTWESAHFTFSSDLKLTQNVVRDLAQIFESTREALLVCPLGLTAGNEKAKIGVRLFQRPVDYMFNGGLAGTAARFGEKDLAIALGELGLKPTSNGLTAEALKYLPTLKHEVTHAILQPAGLPLPVWVSEGFAECVASWPYAQGRYSLSNFDAAMRDHLSRSRKAAGVKAPKLFPPAALLTLTPEDWQEKLRNGDTADYTASFTLLTHYFLFHDGKGDSAGLAGYFDALRGGATAEYAETKHLLRGRSPADLLAELRKVAAKLLPDATVEDPAPGKK